MVTVIGRGREARLRYLLFMRTFPWRRHLPLNSTPTKLMDTSQNKCNIIITFYILNCRLHLLHTELYCFRNIDLVSLSKHALLARQHYAQTTFYRVHKVRKVLILQINSHTLTFQKMLLLFIVSVNTLCSCILMF